MEDTDTDTVATICLLHEKLVSKGLVLDGRLALEWHLFIKRDSLSAIESNNINY